MNIIKNISLFILSLIVIPGIAQQKNTFSMQWKVENILPPENGKLVSDGFAGPISGILQQYFFVGGGANFPETMPWNGGPKKYYNQLYVYAIKGEKLELLNKHFNLPNNIAYAASCNVGTGILFAGGENENGPLNLVWLMQWDESTEKPVFKKMPNLPIAVSNASIAVVGKRVYLAGGETASNTLDQFIVLNLDQIELGWTPLEKMPIPISHTVMDVVFQKASGQIFIAGGRKKNPNGISDFYATMYAYDLATNHWEVKQALPYEICAGTGGVTKSNMFVVFGGDRGTVFHQVEQLIFSINTEQQASVKLALIEQKNKLQSQHPGFSNEVLAYNAVQDSWMSIGNIPYKTPVTTTAIKWGDSFLIPSGEIRAGVRSSSILSVKMKVN
jgi:N-acetylneuraminic acid mutarotase